MPLEATIKSAVLNYLTNLDGCVVEKVFGCSVQLGRPDINGCWKGHALRIELKSPDNKNKVSKAQDLNLKRWAKAGAICFVAYSLNDVKAVINNENSVYVRGFKGIRYCDNGTITNYRE